MGPKKKGKGSKLARMSEEEKIRYLQHRAAIEEEARRRKEQLISTFMKNKLKHEEAFSRLNLAKINQQWRQLLRKCKCKELKDDMEALWHSFETTLAAKEKVIEELLSDLENAEVQYSKMFQSHSETVGNIIETHGERLANVFAIYRKDRRKVMTKADEIRTRIQETEKTRCEHLQTVVFATNDKFSKRHKVTKNDLQNKQDELRNEMVTEMERFEETRCAQIEHYWQVMQHIIQNHNKAIAPVKVHYNSLIEKDTGNSVDLLKHCDMINKYTDMITRMKRSLQSKQEDHTEENNQLIKEKEILMKKFQQLRNSVTDENKLAHIRLANMSVVSTTVIKKLNKVVSNGENMLNVNLNCQKYLTQMEKILPIYCKGPTVKRSDSKEKISKELALISTPSTITEIEQKTEENLEDVEEQDEIIPEPFDKMENFWKEYNKVLLECQSLRKQHEGYSSQNRQLKRLLRHYLNTLARPSSVPNISGLRSARPFPAEIPTGQKK